MKYVDVILPVPLDGTFTYRLPDALVAGCRIGMRVLVPFGKTKTYAGLAVRIHDDAPQLDDEQVKDALSLLDDAPVVLNPQLRLWQWIADYYMSPIGDVMKAALPAGLKAESGYRPKTEVFITVGEKFRSPAALDVAFGLLRRTPRQLEVFRTFLSMDGREVSREALLNEAHCTAAILKRLVDQGFLKTFEREVGRLNTQLPPHSARIQPLSEAHPAAAPFRPHPAAQRGPGPGDGGY